MALADFLRQAATISLLPVGRTTAGGADRTEPEVLAENVPCLVRPRSSALEAFGARRNDARAERIDATIYFAGDPLAPDAELTTRHRITVAGVDYAVRGPQDPNSLGRLLQVDCERLR